jgi:hypothetical protein
MRKRSLKSAMNMVATAIQRKFSMSQRVSEGCVKRVQTSGCADDYNDILTGNEMGLLRRNSYLESVSNSPAQRDTRAHGHYNNRLLRNGRPTSGIPANAFSREEAIRGVNGTIRYCTSALVKKSVAHSKAVNCRYEVIMEPRRPTELSPTMPTLRILLDSYGKASPRINELLGVTTDIAKE